MALGLNDECGVVLMMSSTSVNEEFEGEYSLLWLLDPLDEFAEIEPVPRLARTKTVQGAVPDDEVFEGVNVKELSSEILEGCVSYTDPASFDPAYFIQRRIEETVFEFVSDPKLLSLITYDAKIRVEYVEPGPVKHSDWQSAEKTPVDWREKTFTLAEICTDYHHRVLKDIGYKEVKWPSYYPAELVKTFTDADYQADFRRHVADNLQHPAAHAFGSLVKKTALNKLVVNYIQSDKNSMENRIIAFEYLKGIIAPRTLNLHSDPDLAVDNAVFIGRSNLDRGILFFLGAQDYAIEFPAGHDERGRFLEKNSQLQKLLLMRVPLSAQQKPYVKDFKYRGPEFPLFATRPNYREVVFQSSTDIGKDLFDRQIKRALADIDTLVSTHSERMTDIALEAAGYLLQCVAFAVSLPYGGAGALASAPIRMLIPFLLGLGASATDLIRAELSDDPEEADRLRISAAIGALVELAGPIAEKLLGKALSIAAKKRISQKVLEALKSSNRPSLVRRPAGSISHQLASTTGKEIPGAGQGLVVAGYLSELMGGPNVAQKLATDSHVIRLSGPEKGYVYQGFVFRGDTRDPSVVFEKGFTQRTPIKDINQVNGFKGGYGGAHDALDLDGAGISTSAFYKKDGAGAFVYGGQKGGFTYFVDARQLEGFHLYANTELAFRPNSGLKQLPPLEINYAVDLPPALILGAYDPTGRFIPNPKAIERAIKASGVSPLDGFGRDTGRKVGQGVGVGSELAGVDFGNEGVADIETSPPVTDTTTPPPRPTIAKVDANDINAFRERQEAKRKRQNS
ncbi:hypothetical protein PS943_01653 [Pseudomonas fluorescens]|uniref:Uncharacterized protein n=1 Tax=Pseudomonas fluorescens TaxID=294 RepID=A0A5E7W4Z6_PSEFL|nr:hypothetical protein [Pseudomonas fluorescens]VVQ29924.1 hypothetical protein PS943_01653 [Pseudomonas fluorescens]